MANHGHDDATRAKALTIAAAAGIAEAARVTGVPAGTIKRWRVETGQAGQTNRTVRRTPNEPNRTKRTNRTDRPSQKLRELQAAAIEQAVEEAGEHIAERLKSLADELYSTAETAVRKVQIAIRDPDEAKAAGDGKVGEPHDRDGAAWLRSLVGVMAQAIDKAQLLSGKPTARPEVIDRREIHITEEIIARQPDLLETIFAQDQRPGLEGGRRPGAPAGLGELR